MGKNGTKVRVSSSSMMVDSQIMGKKGKKIGETPSIILINPKIPRNVGEEDLFFGLVMKKT